MEDSVLEYFKARFQLYKPSLDHIEICFGRTKRMTIVAVLGICLLSLTTSSLVDGRVAVCPADKTLLPNHDDVLSTVLISKKIYESDASLNNINGYIVRDIILETDHEGEQLKIVIADKGDTRIVAFRGSNGAEQLLVQGLDTFTGLYILKFADLTEVKVLRYYGKVAEKFLNLGKLNTHLTTEGNNIKRFIFTGHSMGGAVASLVALGTLLDTANYGSVWSNPQTSLITFGQPRVGDKNFAQLHDQLIVPGRKIRVVYRRDAVNYMPPRWAGYEHFSGEVFCPGGSCKVCIGRESSSCSMNNYYRWWPKILDHETEKYYNVITGSFVVSDSNEQQGEIEEALSNTYCK